MKYNKKYVKIDKDQQKKGTTPILSKIGGLFSSN